MTRTAEEIRAQIAKLESDLLDAEVGIRDEANQLWRAYAEGQGSPDSNLWTGLQIKLLQDTWLRVARKAREIHGRQA